MNSREEMLRRVRDGLLELPDDERRVPMRRGRSSAPGIDDRGEVLERFADRLRANGSLVRTVDLVGLPSAIADLLYGMSVSSVSAATEPGPAWLDHWASAPGHQVLHGGRNSGDAGQVVVRDAVAGDASTGSLALEVDGGPDVSSTIPQVCVLRTDRVFGSLPDALDRLDPRRPLVWLGGPVDEELARQLVVVLVE
ncbi:hypothetical protein [Nocardia camponoti]|uniref:Lactate utilization protein C n=1 Tax=Nocardia camponoti TaxID=1616106 RepID=A0A917Q9Y3_9NOCA|nr:hypothetical protein [Nocardia camponoti]GGK35170.1 hypothetical protein GCM10011591_03550 [Nocardia camponoti]